MIKISIVIPVYNAAEYISECLNSISSQTFNGKIECLLVDDCSKDNSVDVINNYIHNYQGNITFRLIKREKNGGASASRNTGIDNAIGEYIMFVDSDDWITPNCLEDLFYQTLKYPDVDLIHAGIKTTDGSLDWFDFEKHPFEEYTDDYHDIKTRLLGREGIPATPYNKLVSLKFIKKNKLYFHEGIVIEDVLWCNQLAKHVHSIACVNKNTYNYRIHEGSVVTSGLGVAPERRLIVYELMINGIDEPFVEEQVEHLIYCLDVIYFANESSEIRRTIGGLNLKLSQYANRTIRLRLRLKSVCAKYDKGNKSIPYYLYYLLAENYSYSSILLSILKKVLRIQ